MIKLTEEQFEILRHNENIGFIFDQGAFIGDNEFILEVDKEEYFLWHISEFEFQGCLVRKKEK